MSIWHFRTGQADAAAHLCHRFHYAGKLPASVWFVGSAHEAGGLFGDFGPALAACVFSEPSAKWSEPVKELSRLIRRDDADLPLTSLISATVRWIAKAKRSECDLLVSFADPAQGHHGGVYQASSWNYHGQRSSRMDGLIVNGQYIAGRTCNHRWGTQSANLLRLRYPDWSIEPHYDVGKHLYWKALTKSGEYKAIRLRLEKVPYPKPDLITREAA